MPGAAVCFEASVARILLDGGRSVLLCGPDADALGRAVSALGSGGRVGVLIGDPASVPDLAAAAAMAAELFGAEPVVVVVRSVEQARQITAGAQCNAGPMG